jgi:hypothetical protein
VPPGNLIASGRDEVARRLARARVVDSVAVRGIGIEKAALLLTAELVAN